MILFHFVFSLQSEGVSFIIMTSNNRIQYWKKLLGLWLFFLNLKLLKIYFIFVGGLNGYLILKTVMDYTGQQIGKEGRATCLTHFLSLTSTVSLCCCFDGFYSRYSLEIWNFSTGLFNLWPMPSFSFPAKTHCIYSSAC